MAGPIALWLSVDDERLSSLPATAAAVAAEDSPLFLQDHTARLQKLHDYGVVLLAVRYDRSRGPNGSEGAGQVAQLGACRQHRDGLPVGVPPQPYGQNQQTAP
ncbi:hypothetical protein [Streptomyces sp. NPDC127190]|uniref:hypothetical protein n=1 Tax=unclassified Streptomyces TaxID=2593676 RepID=UPI0036405814